MTFELRIDLQSRISHSLPHTLVCSFAYAVGDQFCGLETENLQLYRSILADFGVGSFEKWITLGFWRQNILSRLGIHYRQI